MKPAISVLTPSRNQLAWLQLCVASVSDQNAGVEHLIQDASSTDGTVEWIRKDGRAGIVSEPDSGMYDALNRGFQRAGGDIFAHLNCDEQYLPGTLTAVSQFFRDHPDIDVVFGDAVVVNSEGDYLCHRKVVTPLAAHTRACHLGTLTCATFFRSRVFREMNLRFDPRFRAAGDAEWMLRLVKAGVRMELLRQYTSVFTVTGDNLSTTSDVTKEWNQIGPMPASMKVLRLLLILHHRLRRLMRGAYRQKPFSYSIYTSRHPGGRRTFDVPKPSGRWRGWQAFHG